VGDNEHRSRLGRFPKKGIIFLLILQYNGYKESALRCSRIQGDGQTDVDGLIKDSMVSKAVRVKRAAFLFTKDQRKENRS
jgi:hypothetical protein